MRKMLRSNVPRADGGPAVPMAKAFAMAARKVMLSGGPRGIEIGMRLDEKYGAVPPPPPPPREEPKMDYSSFSGFEIEVLNYLLSRAANWSPGEPPYDPRDMVTEAVRRPFTCWTMAISKSGRKATVPTRRCLACLPQASMDLTKTDL